MKPMSKKGLAFNVLIAIFGVIALTIAAVNFYNTSSKIELGALSNQLLRAGFSSERLKNYLDRSVLIEGNNLTFELARLDRFDGCYVYRGKVLWNQKGEECFTIDKFKDYFNKTLNHNLKPRYYDYPFAFFDVNYSFEMNKETLIGYPINTISIKNLVELFELRTSEEVEVPEMFTNVDGLTVSKDLFVQFMLLNHCDTEKIESLHINPDDFKFYIIGKDTTDKGEEVLLLALKGNHTGVEIESGELINECGLKNVELSISDKETGIYRLFLKK